MIVGFDAKRLYNNFTGLGNYSRFVVSALMQSYPGDRYFLYTPRIQSNPDTQPFIQAEGITTVTPSGLVNTLHLGSLWRSFAIGRSAVKNGVQLYHGLSGELPYGFHSRIRKIVTVHDLIFLRYPEFYNRVDVAIYKAKVKYACQVADRVIAVSQQTADDIMSFLKIPESKISVVYQGCHPNFKRNIDHEERQNVRQKYSLPDRYILNVGTIESRKNLALLVKALALLKPDVRIPLVVVGRKTNYYNEVVRLAGEGKLDITFLTKVHFDDLPAIYREAEVFVYPSLFEGFGIPLIEAIESGVPVITSTGSCFSEAAGPFSLYVDPMDHEALAIQLEKVITDNALSQKMVMESERFIERFQPSTIAKHMHRIYEAML